MAPHDRCRQRCRSATQSKQLLIKIDSITTLKDENKPARQTFPRFYYVSALIPSERHSEWLGQRKGRCHVEVSMVIQGDRYAVKLTSQC